MSNQAPSWYNFGSSCITHIFLLIPAVYIFILVLGTNYALFIWHPLCMSIGCGLLMTEAILGVSGEALLVSRFSRSSRIKVHWFLHVVGLALLVIGFAVIVANKNRNNANHFTSDHGKLGLTTFIVSLIVAFGGFLTLYSGLLSQRLSLASMKLIHTCGGIICMILVLACLITGVHRWWPSGTLGRGIVVASYIIGGILLLTRPLYTSVMQIRGFFT